MSSKEEHDLTTQGLPPLENARKVYQETVTPGQRFADAITSFSGSLPFLLINASVFAIWIVSNTLLPHAFHFDPFPFQFLTMAVSLEAIFLAVFVLISQNRQAARDRLMAEQDYLTNVKAEKEVVHILDYLVAQHQHLSSQDELIVQIVKRLDARKKEDEGTA